MQDRIYAYLVEFIVEPDDGQFYAHCPGLGGVHESGKTPEEALANAYDAFLSIVEARLARGDVIPEGPHLVALRTLPELPLEGIRPKSGRAGEGQAQVKELLVPVPTLMKNLWAEAAQGIARHSRLDGGRSPATQAD